MTEHIDLIRKLAWKFHNSTGIDWQELFSEATLGYCIALKSYKADKGKFSTYLYSCVRNQLIAFVYKEQKNNKFFSVEDFEFPRTQTVFFELYDSLSREAKMIANIILKSPHKYLSLSPSKARRKVEKDLIRRGWGSEVRQKGLEDLKETFAV